MPREAGKVLVRIENLADLYDSSNTANLSQLVDVQKLGEALCKSANLRVDAASAPCSVKFRELSLTGNMDIEEMRSRKVQWMTRDDHLDIRGPAERNLYFGSQVLVGPQMIKVYELSFETQSTDEVELLQF
mmetsp:Transcript_1042/g.1907  ORF Transcript_1042/g.1907 Transcript_1042/m.1907 type:complete len:131 (+) Transcript_1042:2891-3283(+)